MMGGKRTPSPEGKVMEIYVGGAGWGGTVLEHAAVGLLCVTHLKKKKDDSTSFSEGLHLVVGRASREPLSVKSKLWCSTTRTPLRGYLQHSASRRRTSRPLRPASSFQSLLQLQLWFAAQVKERKTTQTGRQRQSLSQSNR